VLFRSKRIAPLLDVSSVNVILRTYKIDNQIGNTEYGELDGLQTRDQFNRPENSETANGGNALAKFKSTTQFLTVNNQKKIYLFVSGNAQGCQIDAYVRVSSDKDSHEDYFWEWMPLNGVYGSEFVQSKDEYSIDEWMYEATFESPFTVYDFKLVFRSTENKSPKVYSVRAITTE